MYQQFVGPALDHPLSRSVREVEQHLMVRDMARHLHVHVHLTARHAKGAVQHLFDRAERGLIVGAFDDHAKPCDGARREVAQHLLHPLLTSVDASGIAALTLDPRHCDQTLDCKVLYNWKDTEKIACHL
jgi:hypothetical protein